MIGIPNRLDARGAAGIRHGGPVGNIVRGLLGFAAGIALGIVGIATGVLLLFLPPVGWVLGPVVILGSFAFPVILALCGSRMGAVNCPHCGSRVLGVPVRGSITCYACKNSIWMGSP